MVSSKCTIFLACNVRPEFGNRLDGSAISEVKVVIIPLRTLRYSTNIIITKAQDMQKQFSLLIPVPNSSTIHLELSHGGVGVPPKPRYANFKFNFCVPCLFM